MRGRPPAGLLREWRAAAGAASSKFNVPARAGRQPPSMYVYRGWPHSSLRNLYKKEFQKLAIHMGVSWGFETPPMWMANHA